MSRNRKRATSCLSLGIGYKMPFPTSLQVPNGQNMSCAHDSAYHGGGNGTTVVG